MIVESKKLLHKYLHTILIRKLPFLVTTTKNRMSVRVFIFNVCLYANLRFFAKEREYLLEISAFHTLHVMCIYF